MHDLNHIRPRDWAQWVEEVRELGTPVLLDVREPHEWTLASVAPPEAELVTIPMGVIPPRLHELSPQRPVACLCHHGVRSMQVARFLKSRGFGHVVNIAGGIHAWSHEVDPSIARY